MLYIYIFEKDFLPLSKTSFPFSARSAKCITCIWKLETHYHSQLLFLTSFIKILALENFQVLWNFPRHMTPFYDNDNLQSFSLEKMKKYW